MADFQGFPRETLTFLGGLALHNDRDWFEAHRADYEAHYLAPARAFVVTMGEALKALAPEVRAAPKVNGAIRRINRDTRFSADKTPYKTHMDLMFMDTPGPKQPGSGFMMRIFPDRLMLGVGIYSFDKALQGRYRARVLTHGDSLAAARAAAVAAGYSLAEPELKRVPRGFDAEHPRAGLLKHKSMHAGLDGDIPEAFHSADYVEFCMGHFRALKPMHDWLSEMARS